MMKNFFKFIILLGYSLKSLQNICYNIHSYQIIDGIVKYKGLSLEFLFTFNSFALRTNILL